MSTPHALYRFFDAKGVLLYVGITLNPSARWKAHAGDKPWWTDVAQVTVEHWPDRESVLEAERRAIVTERPRYNVVHNGNTDRRVPLVPPGGLPPARFGMELDVPFPDKALHNLYAAVIAFGMSRFDDRDFTWDAFESMLGTIARSARFGDWCDRCADKPGDPTRYPVRLTWESNYWLAHYLCHECHAHWTCTWSDFA